MKNVVCAVHSSCEGLEKGLKGSSAKFEEATTISSLGLRWKKKDKEESNRKPADASPSSSFDKLQFHANIVVKAHERLVFDLFDFISNIFALKRD